MVSGIGGTMALVHGGRLHAACEHYGGSPDEWLDLSTGIAPWAYPLSAVPESVWQRLPEQQDGLETAASLYYQVDESQLLPIAGSQWAIEQIPRLYAKPLDVAILVNGYAEHPAAWQAAGHKVIFVDDMATLLAPATQYDAAVIIQPHNPLGIIATLSQLTALKNMLKQGILVLDEAFADSANHPTLPLSPHTWRLKSVGKFFGLAGIRLGFVLAIETHIEQLAKQQSPWSVSHVARWAGAQAFADRLWQDQQRLRLSEQRHRLERLLTHTTLSRLASTDYFVTITHPQSESLFHSALAHRILLRHFPAFNGIRFGFPKTEGDWFKLEKWLIVVADL
jgi:cobalamin biosynthetic protein CobC